MNTQAIDCEDQADSGPWHSGKFSGGNTNPDNSENHATVVGRLLIKGIVIATLASIVLPVLFMMFLTFLAGCGSILESFHLIHQKGGDLASVILVFNFILVFLGLSAPEIIQASRK